MKTTVLLCYPRSGSTFTTYILKFLHSHSTLAHLEGRDEKLQDPPFNLDKDTADGVVRNALFDERFIKLHGQDEQRRNTLNRWLLPVVKTTPSPINDPHNLNQIPLHREGKQSLVERTLLILLLRHPVEAFLSHGDVNGPPRSRADYFYKNLKTYHLYDGPKTVIYYEDLVNSPATYVEDLCALYGIPLEVGEMFMRDYEQHFKDCKGSYIGAGPGGATRTDGRTIKTEPKSEIFWEHFFKKCEEFNLGEASSLCSRYYEEAIE